MPLLLADFIHSRRCKPNLRKNVDTTELWHPSFITILVDFKVDNRQRQALHWKALAVVLICFYSISSIDTS